MAAENNKKTNLWWWFTGGMVLYILLLGFFLVAYTEANKREREQLTELHSRLDVLAERVAKVQRGLERWELEKREQEESKEELEQ